MLINPKTKIATLLKHHPDALETIVKLSPDFKKLRNPILRKLMAGRTSIAMASKIGGCQPEDFFKALIPLGFEIDAHSQPEEKPKINQPTPEYLKQVASNKIINFDVRAMLAAGDDPLKEIQHKIKQLQTDEVLLIVNTFEPVPLIKLLEKQGFETYVKQVDEQTIETYFYTSKNKQAQSIEIEKTTNNDAADWHQLLSKFENKLVEIDVRHLEMPMPMMSILEALESLPSDKALYVHHKRIPVFLLTELKDRNFEFRIKEIDATEVFLQCLLKFHGNFLYCYSFGIS